MLTSNIITIILLVGCLSELVMIALYERDIKQLERENRMFQQLLSDRANLQEMSLNAYIAMLREAQRHMDKQ